jgi:NTE family protein
MRFHAALIVLIWFLCSMPAVSQQIDNPVQAEPAHRPKVGLVLEGGSALGLAHIGVLKWLEEHRIPINYVAGTSMGGLVGGIYSTGRSADELKALIKTIDWDEVLRGQTPYSDLSFRRKQDALEYPNKMEFGLKKGLQFPEGFNSGQQVIAILDSVALPYSEVQDFDDLPIPFACVATDLVTSKMFVFRKGSLSIAMRSTMSLPGIFTPVRWNGHILADGGLLDNLPVDVAKSMGADLTLAVHLEIAPLEANASLSSFSVLSKSMSVVVAANELRSMEKADILISVPLQKYNSMGFHKFEELINLGYQAAQSKAALLNTLSVDEPTWRGYLAARAARRRTAPTPQFVDVAGTNPRVTESIEKSLQEYAGQPVDSAKLENHLLDLKGEGRFTSLSYRMTTKDGKPGLLVTATDKPYSPPVLQPLLLLDGSNFSGVDFSMGARITFQDFGAYRAELRTDLMVGSRYTFASEYYRPITPSSKWFIAPRIITDYSKYPIFSRNDYLAEYRRTSAGGGFNIGYEFGRTAQLALGYTATYERFNPRIGNTAILPTVEGRFGATTLHFELNAVDNPIIPRSGQFGTVAASWIDANPGAAHDYPVAEGMITKFIVLDTPSSIYIGARGGTTFGNELVGIPSFSLGSANEFAAYGQNELLTNQYYIFRSGYIRRLAKIPVLLGEGVYLHGAGEVGKVFSPPLRSQVPADGTLGLVINTIFGPIEFGGAVGTSGHRRVFFKLGRLF